MAIVYVYVMTEWFALYFYYVHLDYDITCIMVSKT